MDQLSIYLPPFAGDYSGICSALFELNCLIIIDDASCCTRNYVNYDEPRWSNNKKSTFSSQLRTVEAVLGNEDRLIHQTIEAAKTINPQFITILGTPVPAIIGRDMPSIAMEIEARSGFKTLGFNTTGFSYYQKGVSLAMLKVIQRFSMPNLSSRLDHINILGFTPLDYSANENITALKRFLQNNNLQIVCDFSSETGINGVEKAKTANANLVVSYSGLAAAKFMQQRYGIPYIIATPMGIVHGEKIIKALKQTAIDKRSRVFNESKQMYNSSAETLIIGDQVISNSLRSALYLKGYPGKITVASFFGMEQQLATTGDFLLKNENHLIRTLRSGRFKKLIADPLITELPAAANLICYNLPHPAISSSLHWNDLPVFSSEAFDTTLDKWCI